VVLLLHATRALDMRRRADNLVTVSTGTAEDRAVIRVAHNGAKVAPEHVDRVFEPFSGEMSRGGTGLELSVARRIVENHGGTIAVENGPSQGSAITVTLPAEPAEAPVPSRPSAAPPAKGAPPGGRAAPSPAARRLRLLLVDDDARLLQAYRRWLSRRYDVETAPGAEAALAALERSPSFDAVLCDVMMPGVSGVELYASIVERWPAVASRVVYVTGGAFGGDTLDAVERSGRPVLYKPFDVHDLDVCLSDMLDAEVPSAEAG
jgi:CheY-like chemotaxis protein